MIRRSYGRDGAVPSRRYEWRKTRAAIVAAGVETKDILPMVSLSPKPPSLRPSDRRSEITCLCEYLAAVSTEMARLALNEKLHLLSYLFEMAGLAAAEAGRRDEAA